MCRLVLQQVEVLHRQLLFNLVSNRESHKDLGSMVMSTNYDYIVSTALRTLRLIRRTFSSSSNINEKRLLLSDLSYSTVPSSGDLISLRIL